MAAVAPSADQAAGLLQNLSLDSQTPSKTTNLDISEPTNKLSISQNHSKESPNSQILSNERCVTPVLPDFMDPSLCYLPNSYQHTAYYYGGYDGTCNEWDDYARYMNQDGVEMPPAVFGDNASLMYHSFGYGPYTPYSPAASPVPAMAHETQLFGHQQYQYPTPYFPLTTTSATYSSPPTVPHQVAISSAQTSLSVEPSSTIPNANANANAKGTNVSIPVRPVYQNSTDGMTPYGNGKSGVPGSGLSANGYQDPRFAFDGIRSPVPWIDTPIFSDGQIRLSTCNSFPSPVSNACGPPSSRSQNMHPHASVMSLHQPRPLASLGTTTHGYTNRMHPTKLYGHYANGVRTGLGFGTNVYDARVSDRAWFAVDNKFRNKGRGNGFLGYGNENLDGLNELNRGPRAKGFKSIRSSAPVAFAVTGQNLLSSKSQDEKANLSLVPDREQYNRCDFPESYAFAKFFVIKSYSEDDVHKSIKYNVWSSTPNGNKKLDLSYKEAQQSPVFLFFSVNTSGQFVGLAEMVGPVDFEKNVEYWQQDKWYGSFPVKWHIVKDVPNNLLKHITLENNENKPVTNSRDTQEVKLEQGLQMLKIFKEHSSKTCILDDFGFYEMRQKTIQEKKAKQQQFHKQVWEGKNTGEKSKEAMSVEQQLHKSAEASPPGEAKSVECAKSSKLVVSDIVAVNGVTNSC